MITVFSDKKNLPTKIAVRFFTFQYGTFRMERLLTDRRRTAFENVGYQINDISNVHNAVTVSISTV